MASGQEIAESQTIDNAQGAIPSGEPVRTVGQWQPLDQMHAEERQASSLPALLAGLALLLVLGGLIVWQFRFLPASGAVVAIERGELWVQPSDASDWLQARPSQDLHEGALVQGRPGTVAMLRFADGSVCRLESAGEWQILELRQSRNGRLSRVTMHHLAGRASYMSRAPQPAVDARLRVSLPAGVSLELTGVATVTTAPESAARIELLQGDGTLRGWDRELSLSPGQTVTLDPDTRTILSQ